MQDVYCIQSSAQQVREYVSARDPREAARESSLFAYGDLLRVTSDEWVIVFQCSHSQHASQPNRLIFRAHYKRIK